MPIKLGKTSLFLTHEESMQWFRDMGSSWLCHLQCVALQIAPAPFLKPARRPRSCSTEEAEFMGEEEAAVNIIRPHILLASVLPYGRPWPHQLYRSVRNFTCLGGPMNKRKRTGWMNNFQVFATFTDVSQLILWTLKYIILVHAETKHSVKKFQDFEQIFKIILRWLDEFYLFKNETFLCLLWNKM